jgi:hypothetical protein
MKTYEEVPIAVTKEVLKSIVCDKCHKEYSEDDIFELQEFLSINFTGGYGSVFGDMTHVECDICQHCLLEMIQDICRCKNEMFGDLED